MDPHTYAFYSGMLVCPDCQRRFRIKIGDYYESYLGGVHSTTIPTANMMGSGGRLLSIQPLVPTEVIRGLKSPPIPGEPYKAIQEAIKDMEVGSYKSAASMCRYAIQAALLEKGMPDTRLIKMVNRAGEERLLSSIAVNRCKALVFIGNSGAHPQTELLKGIGAEDAVEGIRLTKRVLLELYDPGSITADD